MSSTVRAALSGSSASSQPRGLPVSTEQKRHARVQTAPISISVAVPAFQHSPMFGHLASSQTVARRCSRTIARTDSKAAPAGSGARSHEGLRPIGVGGAPWLAFTPSRIAVKPCGVTYFWPLFATTTGMSLSFDTEGPGAPGGSGSLPEGGVRGREPLGRPDVAPAPVEELGADEPGAECPVDERLPRAPARRQARKERRLVARDAGVGQPPRPVEAQLAALEPEVAARVLRRIRHQHQVGQPAG